MSVDVSSANEWYGKISIDTQSISNDLSGTKTDINNNESKFGLKGSFILSEGSNINLVYKAEYQFDPVDGKARGDNGTFKQRNTIIGIQSGFGIVFAGTHDSAFKISQLKIDLFNDLAPDIKNILHGENRLKDFIGYTTPKYFGKISATFNTIQNPLPSGKDYKSYSVNYAGEGFQAAIAVDNSMKGFDGSRFAILVPFDRYKIGFIIQKNTNLSTGIKKNGSAISYARNIGSKGTLKIQHASSSMKIQSGKNSTLGYDYQLSENFKIFSFYSKFNSSNKSRVQDILSVGLEYKY